jgi:hypothetical protein
MRKSTRYTAQHWAINPHKGIAHKTNLVSLGVKFHSSYLSPTDHGSYLSNMAPNLKTGQVWRTTANLSKIVKYGSKIARQRS